VYNGYTVGLVIPAYNEADHVGRVIDEIPEIVDRAYVIDDASTDDTWDVITERAEVANERRPELVLADGGETFDRRVVPIRHETNGGRGAAIKTGYRQALADEMDAIAVFDADGQMDPAILDQFLDPIVDGRADYAKGNRLLSRAHREGMSRWRLVGNTLLTLLTKVASGYWRMMDPQNGYTAVSARMLRSLDLDELYDEYGFLNDMLVHLNVSDARVVDVAMRARYGDEESGIRYSRFVPRVSSLLLRDFLWRLRVKYLMFDFHPLVGLYLLGFIAAVGGAGYLGWSVASTLTPLSLLVSLLAFVLSGTLLTFAMIFDRAHNLNLEARIDAPLEARGG
jgi:glycosyltransferase involved in cell wall biosynthesis